MRVLVTGAGGMLAKATVPTFEAAGHEVLPLTRAEGDVTRFESLERRSRAFRPEWIVHLAAFTRVDDCESDPDHAYLVNALGSRNAALAAAAAGAGLLAISTDYVFDGAGDRPWREYDVATPQSVYGASKWAGEQAIREVHPKHVIVRTSWLFGAGGTNFVDTILRKARAGESLRVVDDQRGSPTYTEDLAGGLVKLIAAAQWGTYHVTNAGEATWYDVAAYALARAGLTVPLERTDSTSFPRPARRPAFSVLSNAIFEHVTGGRLPPWRDAVDRYVPAAIGALASGRKEAS